jgi:hypothetical protein
MMARLGRVAWNAAISPLFAKIEEEKAPALPGVSLYERFADELAETDDFDAACRAARVTPDIGQSFLKRLCREAGEQAQ